MFSKMIQALKTGRQLGWSKMFLFARYQFGLRSGWYQRRTPAGGWPQPKDLTLANTGLRFPWREDVAAVLHPGGGESLLTRSDKICAGKVQLFDADWVDLDLDPAGELKHWTNYTSGQFDDRDIKWTWEPGRFGWATILARAYFLSREHKHADAFWEYTHQFLTANPPNIGPHWASAQEVAIRLICLSYCGQALSRAKESTPERKAMLAAAIAQHAARILPTLTHARAIHNNHLLTEALGLYTAGIVLPDHPQAEKWRALGWKWFNSALQNQIAPDGAYIQNSANYHRLMLQAALWGTALAKGGGHVLPAKTRARLAAATHWLLSLVDRGTGRVPNLGPNDGAYILPFTVQPFEDYRPVLQAASQAFLGVAAFPDGAWDEMTLWFGNLKAPVVVTQRPVYTHRIDGQNSWVYLRTAQFTSRPGHADQLHLDLWWRGLNIALDPGTYLYNADPPWDNALGAASLHNTITVNRRDQMKRASQWLWLDWAQAKVTESDEDSDERLVRVLAQHNGYRKLGIVHSREVSIIKPDRWLVIDRLVGKGTGSPVSARLHWLLPDWPWELDGTTLKVQSPHGWITLEVEAKSSIKAAHSQLVRAGELLSGKGVGNPVMGWFSPTYGRKQPALSFSVTVKGQPPHSIELHSTWKFPGYPNARIQAP